MAKGTRIFATNDRYAQQAVTRVYNVPLIGGNVTSTPGVSLIAVQTAGKVTGFAFSEGTLGVDGANPITLAAAVTNLNGASPVAVTSTSASIAKTAVPAVGTFVTTAGGTATGIVPAVIDTTKNTVAPGDVLKVTWTLTRTAPGTEIADVCAYVVVTETQDFDPLVS